MRNDQLAVLLRDFARRALEWAAVLEKQEAGDPVFDRAFIEHGTFSVRLPAVPTTSGTPPITGSSATTPDRSDVGNGGASLQGTDSSGNAVHRAVLTTAGALGWDVVAVRAALRTHDLPNLLYDKLTSYAALYAPYAVFKGKTGRLVLRYRATGDDGTCATGDDGTALTDAEITEALK